MPPPPRQPWLRPDDLWFPRALARAAAPLLLWAAFRLSFGFLLTVGDLRVEERFIAFHLSTGLLAGAGLAWVRGLRAPGDWALWCAAGLAGGILAEALEVWYTYRHLMGTLTLFAWQWFELPATPALIYQMLQGLRAAGLYLPLLLLAWSGENRFSRGLFSLLMVALAVALRVPVRGAYLTWQGLDGAMGWTQLAWYAGSCLALLYGLGQSPLTARAESR